MTPAELDALLNEPNEEYFNWNADWGLRAADALAELRAEVARLKERMRVGSQQASIAEARIDTLEAERDALREMVTLATSVHTMTDEQLDELRANAQAAIDAANRRK